MSTNAKDNKVNKTNAVSDQTEKQPVEGTVNERAPEVTLVNTATEQTEVIPTTSAEPEPSEGVGGADTTAVETSPSTPLPPDPVASDKVPSLADAKGTSVLVIRLSSTLKNYVADMSRGRVIEPVDGGRAQVVLYRAIRGIINAEDNNDFVVGMGILIQCVDENITGVFADNYAFRFFDTITLAKTERHEFENILRLILDIAPMSRRKEYDLAKVPQALRYTKESKRERVRVYVEKIVNAAKAN